MLENYHLPKTLILRYSLLVCRRDMNMERFNITRDPLDYRQFLSNQWKNLRMSLVQVVVFSIFWGPYAVSQAWYVPCQRNLYLYSPLLFRMILDHQTAVQVLSNPITTSTQQQSYLAADGFKTAPNLQHKDQSIQLLVPKP